jgi:hypothetical protein
VFSRKYHLLGRVKRQKPFKYNCTSLQILHIDLKHKRKHNLSSYGKTTKPTSVLDVRYRRKEVQSHSSSSDRRPPRPFSRSVVKRSKTQSSLPSPQCSQAFPQQARRPTTFPQTTTKLARVGMVHVRILRRRVWKELGSVSRTTPGQAFSPNDRFTVTRNHLPCSSPMRPRFSKVRSFPVQSEQTPESL